MWSKYKKVRRIKSFRSSKSWSSWSFSLKTSLARWLWIRWYKRMKFHSTPVISEIDPKWILLIKRLVEKSLGRGRDGIFWLTIPRALFNEQRSYPGNVKLWWIISVEKKCYKLQKWLEDLVVGAINCVQSTQNSGSILDINLLTFGLLYFVFWDSVSPKIKFSQLFLLQPICLFQSFQSEQLSPHYYVWSDLCILFQWTCTSWKIMDCISWREFHHFS